jgi:signal peptidase I
MSEKTRRWKKVLVPVVAGLLVGLALVAVARARSMRAYVVPTSSMSPTIKSGDRVFVDQEAGQVPARGEIWVFAMPPNSGAAPGSLAIKRVIGLPGETIEVRDGKVWINGEALDEGDQIVAPTYEMAPVELGPNEYFMMGDNRNISSDSHIWGPLHSGAFLGRVRGRYWPVSRFGGF